ncbi:MAG: Rieske 2Fe-2S domain-containing protein [Candidatus Dadabacteria bacterium]|nr:Rieske 2Fe-2S domain-containing protein [Candidatus Dadabacteria bacterium]NIQ14055.1 Rieske 2Fe-2S domain-containing protein [Candidatus Dadabacteria bacterium]
MSKYYKIAKTSEFDKDDEIKSFIVENFVIAVCKVGDEFYAFRDECSHQTLPLSDGYMDGEVVTCGYHGAEFNVKTGEALCLPAVEPIETFNIKVEGEDILVLIED